MTPNAIFRVVSIASLLVVTAGIAVHYVTIALRARKVAPAGGQATLRRYGFIERAVLLVGVLTFLALAATGFYPPIVRGLPLGSYLLLAHVGGGAAFMVCLTILAVWWADDCRFEAHDACWRRPAGAPPRAGRFDAGQKAAFWAALALGGTAIFTMMVSMLPLFGPHGLEVLREVHRYSGLALLLVGYVHGYRTMCARRGSWGWLVSGKVPPDWAKHYHPVWWQGIQGERDR